MKRTILLLMGAVCALLSAQAQPAPRHKITGKVVSAKNGQPLQAATVKIKNTSRGTTTDNQGRFSLDGVNHDAILVVSSIGFETQKVIPGVQARLTIRLKPSKNLLDETIIRAYGTTTRRLNTGNISKVSAREIERQPISNPLLALEGRVPGLWITQRNGLPGSNTNVLIRGRNSIQQGTQPLYIIDGVPFFSGNLSQRSIISADNPFNSINPADIKSIEVLKDADATAIYGSRGANGVILITTKRPVGGPIKLAVNAYNGWGKITRSFQYMNTHQYLQMRREAFRNDGVTPTTANARDLLVWDTTRYTDWKKLLIGGTARLTNALLSLSGGGKYNHFSLNAGYYRESTVFPSNNADQRKTIHFKFNHQDAGRKLDLNLTFDYSLEDNKLVSQDPTPFIYTSPDSPLPYDSTGNLNWTENGAAFSNPLSLLRRQYNGLTNRLTSSVLLSYALGHGLKLKVNTGYNTIDYKEVNLVPISSQYPGGNPTGRADFGDNKVQSWVIEPQLQYLHKWGTRGTFSGLAGASWQENKQYGNIADGTGYKDDHLLKSIAGAASISASNSYSLYHYEALFGRLNYNWDNKYLIDFTARRDASSRFGPGNKFANFYAIGIGWIFSSEKFIKSNIPFLSFGKIRSSYGVTGNDQINDYQFLDTWIPTRYNYDGIVGLAPSKLNNPDYQWEINHKLEMAVELGFLDDKLYLTASWYRNQSSNQIVRYSLPGQAGFTSILMNFPGKVQNTGSEIEINTINIQNRAFRWQTGFNLTIARNKLLAFPGLAASSYANSYRIGQPLNILIGYHYLGIDPKTGVYTFADKNRDGDIDSYDYVTIGTTDPKFYGGLQNNFHYRNWEFNIFFQFIKQKGKQPIFKSVNGIGTMFNQPVDVLNRWQHPGDQSLYEKYTANIGTDAFNAGSKISSSSAVLVDASYIRLKSFSLAYSLPDAFIQKLSINDCQVYLEGNNFLTITDYPGLDPETQDAGSLPPLKKLVLGIRLDF